MFYCERMAGKIASIKLPSGADIPVIGLGTWKSEPGQVETAVKTAIDIGYRHIDCAMVYCNEKEVGAAIKAKIDDGTVKREDLFITSKLWNTRHKPSDVRPSIMETLEDLGLDYLDLYLLHWPQAYKPSYNEWFPIDENGDILYSDIHPRETYKAMEKCVEEGLVRDIGVSNFNSEQVQDILDNCKIKPAINQVEMHPYFTNKKLAEYCMSRGITMTAYAPLGSSDRPWSNKQTPPLLEDSTLKSIAERIGKTPAQVVLRYLLTLNVVVIPKSVTPSRIAENFDIFDFELTSKDIEAIDKVKTDQCRCFPSCYIEVDRNQVLLHDDRNVPNFPFNIEF